jgi:hypothetical protein
MAKRNVDIWGGFFYFRNSDLTIYVKLYIVILKFMVDRKLVDEWFDKARVFI